MIIYFACGSPFGVYYFLDNREQNKLNFLKSIIVTTLWVPYALKLLHFNITSKLTKNYYNPKKTETSLVSLQKELENFLPNENKELSLFELREVIERYVGLNEAVNHSTNTPSMSEKELYKITENNNSDLSALCLMRKNLFKLEFHQDKSRVDFLKSLKILFSVTSDRKKLGKTAIEFVKLLNDRQTLAAIENLIIDTSQIPQESNVIELEKELWTPRKQPQLSVKQLPIRFQALTTVTNSQKKD